MLMGSKTTGKNLQGTIYLIIIFQNTCLVIRKEIGVSLVLLLLVFCEAALAVVKISVFIFLIRF